MCVSIQACRMLIIVAHCIGPFLYPITTTQEQNCIWPGIGSYNYEFPYYSYEYHYPILVVLVNVGAVYSTRYLCDFNGHCL